jgi:hypothetical protein
VNPLTKPCQIWFLHTGAFTKSSGEGALSLDEDEAKSKESLSNRAANVLKAHSRCSAAPFLHSCSTESVHENKWMNKNPKGKKKKEREKLHDFASR